MWQEKGLFLNVGIEEHYNYYEQWSKYFRTNKKNNLDIDSYVRCLTQRNCKGLKVM